ncbi:macrophage mannose receptor 1-like isoform X1 [Buteo buteo]|uniref:macrophage mannose receptor 1-like isoform X1 n=1 Tax=Buteo buteo TaxID=30397 RepID=UPI003EB98DA0
MYGNIESSQAGQGQMWELELSGGEACSDLCSTEENPYEPLDSANTVPSQKHVPDPPGTAWARARASSKGQNHAAVKAGATQLCPNEGLAVTHPPSSVSGCCSREKLVLVGTVALGVSVLMNVIFLAVGSQHIAALTEALEAEKVKKVPNVASCSFLLYNEDHRKCVEARGQQLMVTKCQPDATAQRFQWLQGGRLRGWGSQHCITATRGQSWAVVGLEPCRDDGELQRWECRDGGLLALVGYDLYFNYGNHPQHTVMLYTGNREWSRWVVHGSKDDVCSRSCCPPCSKGWTHFGKSCYFYSKTVSSWEKAQHFCSVLGMQLLEVDSPEEKDHIRTILQTSSWLSIRDEEVEGTWKRANGTILPRESSFWHRNEPNGGHQENCAVVREDGEWYDYPCTSQLPWVCKGHP